MKHFNFRRLLFTAACLLVGSLATYAADDDLTTQQVTITLDEAGTLPNKISSSDKYRITNLKIIGEINGTDLKMIRDMAEISLYYSKRGKLSILDLGEAQIVSGGDPYYNNTEYTKDDKVGDYAFYGCIVLTNVILPPNVTSIGESAFEDCSCLKSVTIPSSVTSIGSGAFYDCSSLKSVTIPSSVTSIGSSAFSDCSSLTSVTIPSSVTSIGEYAFHDCSSLTSVTIPNSVTSIGISAFSYCTSLTSVTIPNSVTSIGMSAFCDCSSLVSVTIPNSVIYIDEYAFRNTDIKKAIWLTNTPPSGYDNVGADVNYVANNSFSFSSGRTFIYPYLSSLFEVDGVKYVPVSPSERTCDAIDCAYDETAANINIGKTVNYKGIEMNVKDIKSYFCYKNPFIKTVKIDNDACNIPDYSFRGCSAMTTVDITTASIGERAFYGCSAMTTANVTTDSIGERAFYGCSAITTANIMTNSIGESAFYGCEKLNEISIPDQVKSIEEDTFNGCSSLASVAIGSGVTTIGDEAFSGCSSLNNITIPQNVTEIGNRAFCECTSLADVNIADRDTELTLGESVFEDTSLKSVYIGGNITYPTSSSEGYSPFYRNTTLESVTITDKETEISENEFYGCTALKEVSIGDGIEKIGNYAFSGCSALESFSFGTSLKSIGDEAFSDCTAMTKLTANAQVPPTCGDQALDDINKWSCTLYVPQAQIDAYKAAAQWKEFFFVEPTGVQGVTMDSDAKEVARYNLNGARLAAPQRGINVVRMSDGSTKKVLVK